MKKNGDGARLCRPKGSVRCLHRPEADTNGWQTIEIRLGRTTTFYRCRPVPTDFGREYHGFELHKLGGDLELTGVVYHVLVDLCKGWHRCDCLGHEAHGHCKHSAAIAALCRSAARPYRPQGLRAAAAARRPELFQVRLPPFPQAALSAACQPSVTKRQGQWS
jgi:hypothetical protein